MYEIKQKMWDLFQKFSGIEGYDGWMIGRAEQLEAEDTRTTEDIKTCVIKKKKKDYIILEAFSQEEGLRLLLIKPSVSNQPERSAGECSMDGFEPVAERSFTAEEILFFVKETKDTNPIHRTNSPVVPGLMMYEWFISNVISKEEPSGRIQIHFREPLFAGENLMIYRRRDRKEYAAITQREGKKYLIWEGRRKQ